jgi:ubiquitin carboxyl-terminal hydrolase 8
MNTNDKIDLYIANNLEELNKRVENNPSIEKAKLSNCAQITNIIEETWKEAKKSEINRDEERAYILYMRLYTCFIALTKAKDIATNRSTIQHYQKGAIIWFEKAEQLSESLKARYDIKNAAKIEEERRIQAEIDEENSLEKSITPKLLYKYLNERKKNILLIDMRLKSDYDQSHMRTSACINIPADLMNGKGWTTWGIESTLTNGEDLKKFKQRADFDYIVLFDKSSYEDDLKPGNSLMGLKQAIFTLDRDVKLKHEPLIIQGGYEDWMVYYPGLSTGPLISKEIDGQLRSFEVCYPDDEILPQEVPNETATIAQPEAAIITPAVVPQFDRTRKPMNNLKPESPTELPVKPVIIQFINSDEFFFY